MASDSRNSKIAKATGLLFDIASAQEAPFAMLLYIQYILHGLIWVLLCVPFIFTQMVLILW